MNWKQFYISFDRLKKQAQKINKKHKKVMIIVSTRIKR